MRKKLRFKTTLASCVAAASAVSLGYSAEEHDHDHHKEYLADGPIDIALVYDADHSELEFKIFAEEDHGHDHGDEHDHADEHGDEHDHADEHGDEHDHADDHGDEHDHADDHGDEHDHADEHGDEHDHADEHGDEHDHADEHGDERDHADEHGDEHDHADEHGDEHDHADEHGDEHDHADEHGDEHDHADEHDHSGGLDLGDAVILGGASTTFVLPDGDGFDFLGNPGDEFYRLPQDAASGPAAPGFAMEFEGGIFTNDEGSIELTGFEGPGHLVAYILGGFGDVNIVFDTRDGLDASDTFTGPGETHQHLNWVFTEPGIYHIDLEGRAELASNSTILSTTGELKFHIGSGLAYLREVEGFQGDWAMTENLGDVYTADFPWLYMPLLKSWAFGMGEGGDDMVMFVKSLDTWTYTGAETAPWFYDFSRGAWIYVLNQPDGSVWIFDFSTQAWSELL